MLHTEWGSGRGWGGFEPGTLVKRALKLEAHSSLGSPFYAASGGWGRTVLASGFTAQRPVFPLCFIHSSVPLAAGCQRKTKQVPRVPVSGVVSD